MIIVFITFLALIYYVHIKKKELRRSNSECGLFEEFSAHGEKGKVRSCFFVVRNEMAEIEIEIYMSEWEEIKDVSYKLEHFADV